MSFDLEKLKNNSCLVFFFGGGNPDPGGLHNGSSKPSHAHPILVEDVVYATRRVIPYFHLPLVKPKRKLGHEINCMVAFPVNTSYFHFLSD